MSTWFPEQPKAWYHRMCLRILGFGQIPKHVAVIMDGNRRFAVKNSMERAEGHLKGFDKLTEVLYSLYFIFELQKGFYKLTIEIRNKWRVIFFASLKIKPTNQSISYSSQSFVSKLCS